MCIYDNNFINSLNDNNRIGTGYYRMVPVRASNNNNNINIILC